MDWARRIKPPSRPTCRWRDRRQAPERDVECEKAASVEQQSLASIASSDSGGGTQHLTRSQRALTPHGPRDVVPLGTPRCSEKPGSLAVPGKVTCLGRLPSPGRSDHNRLHGLHHQPQKQLVKTRSRNGSNIFLATANSVLSHDRKFYHLITYLV